MPESELEAAAVAICSSLHNSDDRDDYDHACAECWDSAQLALDAIRPFIEAEVREQVAREIKAEADKVWAEIEKYTYRHYGALEPASVDPFLAEKHAGLIAAAALAAGGAQ